MTRRILITGGAGNVGASLARRLVLNPRNHVVIVDSLVTGSLEKLPSPTYSNWQYVRADVNSYGDLAPIMVSSPFEIVFHYAAVVGVKRTLENPHLVLRDI